MQGIAYTLVTQAEDRFAGLLVENLESAEQPVPPALLELAMKNPKWSAQYQKRKSGKDGGSNGRGGGG